MFKNTINFIVLLPWRLIIIGALVLVYWTLIFPKELSLEYICQVAILDRKIIIYQKELNKDNPEKLKKLDKRYNKNERKFNEYCKDWKPRKFFRFNAVLNSIF